MDILELIKNFERTSPEKGWGDYAKLKISFYSDCSGYIEDDEGDEIETFDTLDELIKLFERKSS